MLEGRANAELGGDLLLVFLLGLSDALWFELLDGKDTSAVLAARLDEANRAAGTAAEDAAPLSVLFGKTSMGSVLKRDKWMGAWNRRRDFVVDMSMVRGRGCRYG